jgi:hypothetical protein
MIPASSAYPIHLLGRIPEDDLATFAPVASAGHFALNAATPALSVSRFSREYTRPSTIVAETRLAFAMSVNGSASSSTNASKASVPARIRAPPACRSRTARAAVVATAAGFQT